MGSWHPRRNRRLRRASVGTAGGVVVTHATLRGGRFDDVAAADVSSICDSCSLVLGSRGEAREVFDEMPKGHKARRYAVLAAKLWCGGIALVLCKIELFTSKVLKED